MKTKCIVIGLATLIASCGVVKNERSLQSQKKNAEVSPVVEILDLNENSEGTSKIKEHAGRNQALYYVFGEVDLAKLPADIAELSTESEIGTLSIIQTLREYAPEYTEEAVPSVSEEIRRYPIKVFLLIHADQSRASLAVRGKEQTEAFKTVREPITVKSKSTEYCSHVHQAKQAHPSGTVPEQSVPCNPQGQCSLGIITPYGTHFEQVSINWLYNGGSFCGRKANPGTILYNESKPVIALVDLLPKYQKITKKLQVFLNLQ